MASLFRENALGQRATGALAWPSTSQAARRSSGRPCRTFFFDKMNAEFGFTLVRRERRPKNAKCARYLAQVLAEGSRRWRGSSAASSPRGKSTRDGGHDIVRHADETSHLNFANPGRKRMLRTRPPMRVVRGPDRR